METSPPEAWYRLRVASIPLFIIIYFVIAALPPLMNEGGEKYLFYSWFVFTEVPSRVQTTYEAEVVEITGRPVKPLRIESAGVLFFDELRNRPAYNQRIRTMGRLMDTGSTEAKQKRRDFERYITVRPIAYRVVKIQYNPIERFKDGSIISTEVIGRFEVK